MPKYKNTRITYINNKNNKKLLFYSTILVNLLVYDYASIRYRITYDIDNKNNKAINNWYIIFIIRRIL